MGVDMIVQFSAAVYFVEESEEVMTIDVIRLGSLKGRSRARYHTVNGSAKAGAKYEYTEGDILFEDGDYMVTIEVEITQDQAWSPTLEFKVALEDPEGCILVPDGSICRVKIIDDDKFPSNRYREELEEVSEESIENINQWGLFAEYVSLNVSQPGMRWRTYVSIVCDQLHNLYLFFLLTARTYLVNVVFDQDSNDDTSSKIVTLWRGSESALQVRIDAARLVAVMYVLPMLILHIWDYMKLKIDIEGHSRVFLQKAIFRKYLNYSEASRQAVRVSHMQVALLSNTTDLAKAYVSVLEMVKMIGKLVLLMIFMLTQDPDSAWVLVVMPGLMLVWGICRSRALSEASDYAGPLKKILIDLTTEVCAKYRLIADYAQRPQMNDLFQRRADELRRSEIPESQVELNNNYFPKWLGPIFSGAYIAWASEYVLTKEMSLGVFLATLSVFSEVSGDFSSLYERVMEVNTRLDALKTLTIYFNMETEVLLCKTMNRKRRQATKDAWAAALKNAPPAPEMGLLRSDLIPIRLENLCFSFPPGIHNLGRHVFELKNVNLSVAQGQLVAVVGPHGSGKGTFMRLLAQTIFPTSGAILLPMHLRVLFVGQLPVLFDRSIWYNLVFGRPDFNDIRLLETMLQELEMDTVLQLMGPELDARIEARRTTKRLTSADLKSLRDWKARGSLEGSPASSRRFSGSPDRRQSGAARVLVESVGTRGSRASPTHDTHLRGKYSRLGGSEDDDDNDDASSNTDDEESEEMESFMKMCWGGAGSEEDIEIDEDHSWQDMLSFTEQVKLCLIRAMLMNPEVLVLHRPFHNYDIYTQKKVLDVLLKHKENRGLGLPKADWANRRPRTIFFTPESMEQAKAADVIWQIDAARKTIKQISATDLQEGFHPTKQQDHR